MVVILDSVVDREKEERQQLSKMQVINSYYYHLLLNSGFWSKYIINYKHEAVLLITKC